MKLQRQLLLLLLAISGTIQAISWQEYYQKHEKEIAAAVEAGKLDLSNKGLTDLIGFGDKQNFDQVKELDLSHNELTHIPATISAVLPALEQLNVSYNQLESLPSTIGLMNNELQKLYLNNNKFHSISSSVRFLKKAQVIDISANPLTEFPSFFPSMSQLRQLWIDASQLSPEKAQALQQKLGVWVRLGIVDSEGKTPAQVVTEQLLLEAIKNGQIDDEQINEVTIPGVRQLYRTIMTGKVLGRRNAKIDIAQIYDTDDNNLLHVVVQSAAAKISKIRAVAKQLPKGDKARQILEDGSAAVDQVYTKILGVLIQFGGPKVEQMILTRNPNNEDVVQAAIAALGKNSALVKTLRQLKPAQRTFRMVPRTRKPEDKKEREEKIAAQAAEQITKLTPERQQRTNQTLFAAIIEGKPLETINDLIDNKHAQIDGLDVDGKTPLIIAAIANRPEVVEALLARVKNKEKLKEYLAMKDNRAMVWGETGQEIYEGRTALDWAQHHKYTEIIAQLVEAEKKSR